MALLNPDKLTGVDPSLAAAIKAAAADFPYDVSITPSGARDARKSGTVHHPAGRAVDVIIHDGSVPVSQRGVGHMKHNYQNPNTFMTYYDWAQAVYDAADPETKANMAWGGTFGGRYAVDQMHIDVSGARGAYGKIQDGLAGIKLDAIADRLGSPSLVRQAQERLKQLGANIIVDGIWGPASRAAARAYNYLDRANVFTPNAPPVPQARPSTLLSDIQGMTRPPPEFTRTSFAMADPTFSPTRAPQRPAPQGSSYFGDIPTAIDRSPMRGGYALGGINREDYGAPAFSAPMPRERPSFQNVATGFSPRPEISHDFGMRGMGAADTAATLMSMSGNRPTSASYSAPIDQGFVMYGMGRPDAIANTLSVVSSLAGAPQKAAAPSFEEQVAAEAAMGLDPFGGPGPNIPQKAPPSFIEPGVYTTAPIPQPRPAPPVALAPPVPQPRPPIAFAPPPPTLPPLQRVNIPSLMRNAPDLTGIADAPRRSGPDAAVGRAIGLALGQGATRAQAAAAGRNARALAQPGLYGTHGWGGGGGSAQAVQAMNEYNDLKAAGYFGGGGNAGHSMGW